MFTYRTINLVVGALLVLVISSCSQSATNTTPATDTAIIPEARFELNEVEREAIAKGDKSSLTVKFGDPALGATSFNAPPSVEDFNRIQGREVPSATRSASCYDNNKCTKHRKRNCTKCQKTPPPCRKVTGICNVSERFWKVEDCCSQTADVTYGAQVDFDGDGDLSGVEVIFSRDGQEIGRANTNADGLATFTEKAVTRGPHNIRACVSAEATAGTCTTCTTTKNDCTKDKNSCDSKSKGSRSSSCVTPPPPCTPPPPPPPPCNCASKEKNCDPCSSIAVDGYFCADIDYAVYTDCIQGAVTGTGYFPSCNPLRQGLRDQMNFRIAYDQGAVQGYLNYSAGQYAGAPKVDNGQVKWLLISGVESWFGGDTFMVHVIDGGATFSDDYFEIWIDDPATCTKYCCGGNLTGCYVHVSYKYTQKCP